MQSGDAITGAELRELIFRKWGRSYDVRLQRRGNRVYLHVMWKYLEQQSFPLSSEEYQQQLDAVAAFVQVRAPVVESSSLHVLRSCAGTRN